MGGLAFPKPRPQALERDDRRKARASVDELESRKVRQRSGGRCEITTEHGQCNRVGTQVHHMIGGWGKRARSSSGSVSAEVKQHACIRCHELITRHILVRQGNGAPHWTDVYTRVR